MVKVIASSVRKGNVLDLDGKLAVVMHAENIHPGKGTPVTQLDMRRISDGVKVSERYRTTEQVERAFVEDKEYDFLYVDGESIRELTPDRVGWKNQIWEGAHARRRDIESVGFAFLHDFGVAGDHLHVQPHQRTDVGIHHPVAARHQHHFIFAGQVRHYLGDARIKRARMAFQFFQ